MVPAAGDGRSGRAGGGPGGSGSGSQEGSGDAGPPRRGGGGVSDRDAPGRWDEPGGEQGRPQVPREWGPRPSTSIRRELAGR